MTADEIVESNQKSGFSLKCIKFSLKKDCFLILILDCSEKNSKGILSKDLI